MNTPNIKLRAEQPADVPFLLSLYATTRVDVALSDLPEQQKRELIEQQFNAQRYSYQSNYVNTQFAIIEMDGKPVGRFYLSKMPRETRVMDILIAPAHRNRGIGTCLLRAVQTEARLDGVAVTLHAEKEGNMAGYYQRFGFEIVEEKETHYFMKWASGSSILVT